MEAVPKLPFLSFYLKVNSENTHFGPKLKQYIAEAYREDADSYGNEIHQLESLRSAAIRPSIDASGLNALCKYYCQLRALQSRFPMAKGQPVAISFAWKDLYANMNCSLADIRFEMACILYNIGAMHTQLGALEPRTTADGLKSVCTHYQNAAWSFQCLQDQFPQPSGVDLCTEILKFIQEICFAQAQECILEKSIQDTRKPSVIGAVATQVLQYYRNSLSILGPSTGQDNIHEIVGTKQYNLWYRYLSFKTAYIGCIVALYQGMQAEEQQKMGERVAYYQHAVDKLAEARKLEKYIQPVDVTQEALTFTNDVVEGKRKAAKNENEFIYHEEVPDKSLLSDFKPVCLVKALPINFNDPEISGPDIFSRLVPMGAHEASSLYSEEKAKLLRHVVSLADTKNAELAEFMSSLQLDQLDTVLNADQRIPQEIVDRCAAINGESEIIQRLVDSMNSLAEIISDVEHSLAEIKDFIQEETAKEKEYQKVMGPRPPSIVQTELSREFNKYQEAHTRTNESNQVLHKAMTLHIANLRLLALPLDQLEHKIPSIDNIEGLDRQSMTEMNRVVSKAREMQRQRETLIQQLRDAVNADDITTQLLARSSEPLNEIFKQEVEKHTAKVKIIEQNLAAQENIINRLTSLYASYGESRRLLTDVMRKREGLINALITSYDTCEELLAKSQKGLEFYRKLSNNVAQLLTRMRSTCQVQEEERAQLLAKHNTKATPPQQSSASIAVKNNDVPINPVSSVDSSAPKLKDYLPYMKSRGLARTATPVQPESIPSDAYYPENVYPTSVRPAPLGSEATTDASQMKYPDGYVIPNVQNPNLYNAYMNQYGQNENNSYSVPPNYPSYPITSKNNIAYDQQQNIRPSAETDNTAYGYNSQYMPAQLSTQMTNPQSYNPSYYTGTQDNTTVVTDSPKTVQYDNTNIGQVNPNQHNMYGEPYSMSNHPSGHLGPMPDTLSAYSVANQTDLNAGFNNMQIGLKDNKSYETNPHTDNAPGVNYSTEYSQTYYSFQYPQVPTSQNMTTYSRAEFNSNTFMSPSQVPAEYNSLNYPYSGIDASTAPISVAQGYTAHPMNPDVSVAYVSTGIYDGQNTYPTYTVAQGATHSVSSSTNVAIPTVDPSYATPYSNPNASEPDNINPALLSQLEADDKPIKSHVTGEALSSNLSSYSPMYQSYNETKIANVAPYLDLNDPNCHIKLVYSDQPDNVNYSQTYQNHPGYTYNTASGNYDYNYGSQNSFGSYVDMNPAVADSTKDQNWSAHGMYTNACQTVQSPSENPQMLPQSSDNQSMNQNYYNSPYGHETNQTNDANTQIVPEVQNETSVPPNYLSNYEQSIYMQSEHTQDTNVTFSSNQDSSIVSSPTEIKPEPSFAPEPPPQTQTVHSQDATNVKPDVKKEVESPPERDVEPSTFDLLSDIDFTVKQNPLTPHIKVPQISESAIKKPISTDPVVRPVSKPQEVVIERPAKRDVFSDPGLLNEFTQEVKKLQRFVDGLTNKTIGGMTVLDSKWMSFQEIQTKESMNRTKTIAMQNSDGNIVTEVVPYDDTRLILKADPDAYINASYYKQLASWCVPLVISKLPVENEYSTLWNAVLENKIVCIVCLLSEIEMQGISYWPTAKGQTLDLQNGIRVTLEEVICNVHWTERKLSVTSGKNVLNVLHYQITVFPAKVVCSPLVLLADKVVAATYDNRLSNQLGPVWVQCAQGAGRSSVLSLLLAAMCQVRAGQVALCDMLDAACINLYKHRTNVLEDTKYLADAYRTTLYYVQGVLCSGNTMFNGEAVAVQSGAAVLPPVTALSTKEKEDAAQNKQQHGKFSRESFEEMRQSPGLKSGDMKDPLNFLDPLWSLKKK